MAAADRSQTGAIDAGARDRRRSPPARRSGQRKWAKVRPPRSPFGKWSVAPKRGLERRDDQEAERARAPEAAGQKDSDGQIGLRNSSHPTPHATRRDFDPLSATTPRNSMLNRANKRAGWCNAAAETRPNRPFKKVGQQYDLYRANRPVLIRKKIG